MEVDGGGGGLGRKYAYAILLSGRGVGPLLRIITEVVGGGG